eukprot:m.384232 g.384232  ORF g.384232 m.384232 type:complete len:357 (-) comp20988_c0_seq1:2284-3354(-)
MSTLVADIGSLNTRVGWNGDDLPKHVIPSTIQAASNAGATATWPVQRGIVHDWTAIEALWHEIFRTSDVDSTKDTPIIFADSPTTLEKDRGTMAELLFEKFEVPAYFVGSQAVFSLYSAGRTSGVVVDAGYGVLHTMAVHEGFAFPHTLGQLDLGGMDLARNIGELLADRGVDLSKYNKNAICSDIIEKHARVALEYAKEAHALRTNRDTAPTYTLPDGLEIQLESEHVRCTEALFQPALAGCRGTGLTELLWEIVTTCDADREGGPMRALPQYILVVGGCSLLPGLQQRIEHELRAKAPVPRDIYVTCLATPERHHAAWIGASLLASLPQFVENNFVHRAEYLEEGEAAVHKRCV